MRAVDLAIGLCWLAFWIYWLASAVGVKSGRTRWGRFAGVRVVMIVAIVLLLRLHAFRGNRTTHDPWLVGIGVALFFAGLGLAIWARIFLGRNWGTPMTEKDDPELVTSGPYRFIRNPIYSGLILAMIGTALAVSFSWLAPAAVAGCYFVYSAFMEQRFMAARFPDSYPAYRRSTKMLIPFVF